jgi:hypothetical protein
MGAAVDRGEGTVLVAQGFGGYLELEGNRLRIVRGGWFGYLVTLFGLEGGFVERTVRVDQISSIELDVPVMFFRYIRFSYPGSPAMTGNNIADMLAENSVIMSLVDNRPSFRIAERIEEMMDHAGAPRA